MVLKIFLADLTYNTVTLSTDAFPLNVGFIASYAKKIFGSQVEFTLFKYIDELEQALIQNPPDVLGCSNYCWNERIGLEMFRLACKMNPDIICISGGPNFPLDPEQQKEFLIKRPEIDAYVPVDGEEGFVNVIRYILDSEQENDIKLRIREDKIDGSLSINSKKELIYSIPVIRSKELDDIPSPYLGGFLDKFFDGKLAPMIQTNRGCPFSCTFCTDGTDLVNKVNQFSTDRVRDELHYIAEHISPSVHSLHISDLNFGMYHRDLDTCSVISEIIEEKNYPSYINTATGKNAQEKIISAIKKLAGSLRLRIAVQSMDQEVLRNIKRDNISVDKMLSLAPSIKEAGLNTESEVILGLPGDTFQSHVNSLRDLVRAGIDHVESYTCMLLPGAEMSLPKEREKWKYNTKFRILPRDFVELRSKKKILEIEEVIISSKTLTYEEYKEIRELALIIFVNKIGIVYEPIIKFFQENNVDVFDVFLLMHKNRKSANELIQNVFVKFLQSTEDELWDSPEQIEENYQKDSEFKKLLTGEAGINVIQFYHTKIMVECMNEWTDYFIECCTNVLRESNRLTQEKTKQFSEISDYCRGLSHNVLGNDRMDSNPEFIFTYDIKKWVEQTKKELDNFMFENPIATRFTLTDKQFLDLEDNIRIFGGNLVGMTSAVKNTQIHMLWRKPSSQIETILN